MDLKATSIRYFATRRGVGYECETNNKNIIICNDGNGGATYIVSNGTSMYDDLNENQLEEIIDEYERQ